MAKQPHHESKIRLLNGALNVIRTQGYAATTVDDICQAAGVTKGSFFHHFKSKDDLALSAAAYWGEMTEEFFAAAPYHHSKDPLERLLGYVDFRGDILRGDLPDYTLLSHEYPNVVNEREYRFGWRVDDDQTRDAEVLRQHSRVGKNAHTCHNYQHDFSIRSMLRAEPKIRPR